MMEVKLPLSKRRMRVAGNVGVGVGGDVDGERKVVG